MNVKKQKPLTTPVPKQSGTPHSTYKGPTKPVLTSKDIETVTIQYTSIVYHRICLHSLSTLHNIRLPSLCLIRVQYLHNKRQHQM